MVLELRGWRAGEEAEGRGGNEKKEEEHRTQAGEHDRTVSLIPCIPRQ